MAISAPRSLNAGAAVTCWWVCACAQPRTRTPIAEVRSCLTTNAAPPSETGQQSSSFSGSATGFEAITSPTVMGFMKLRAGMRQCVLSHQHCEFGEVGLGHAIFVHVARGDQAIIGRDGRAQRYLVIRMSDLRQRQDRGVPALSGQPVLA